MKFYNTLISLEEMQDLLRQQSAVLLDCTYYLIDYDRGRREYLQAHIPGAFYLDTGHDLSSPVVAGQTGRHPLPHPEILANTLRHCGLDQDMQVIAYDQSSGVYASRAWWLLNWLGHAQVAVLDGGYQQYKQHHLETDNQWPPPLRGNFVPQLQDHLVISKEDVQHDPTNLIDSREYKRYTGETEPIDPIPGHIPGAVCIPYMDNVTDAGMWQPKSYLASKFESLADTASAPVFYCGSGVTACHNVLAYKIATNRDARLYAGSYSEWINYYPVATSHS